MIKQSNDEQISKEELLAENKQLKQQLQSLKWQNKDLQSDLDSMLNSRSWRVTRPMRSFKAYLVKFFLHNTLVAKLKNYFVVLSHRVLPTRYKKKILKILVPTIDFQDKERLSVFMIPKQVGGNLSVTSSDKPKVSIVIPVYNQYKYTYNCLKSISLLSDKTSYEVIIADDNSSDETINIQNIIHGIKVVKNRGERGFLNNCNNAAKEAKGEYLYFLNNDTALFDGALDVLVQTLEHDKNIGLIGSKLIYADMSLQEAGGIIWNDASGWNYGRNDSPIKPKYMYLKEVDYVSGASMMIPKKIWEKIGGFDVRYAPAYYEDTDLAFEVRKAGYKVVFQPRSVVLHFEGKSCGTDINSGIKSYQVKNREKFYDKWQDVLKEHASPGGEFFHSRDRSYNKKTILFLDYIFPTFDCDAGSRNIFSYIKLYLEQGLNVKFIPLDGKRSVYYSDVFENFGIECLYGQANKQSMWDNWFKENGSKIDYVYIYRSHVADAFLPLLRKYTTAKIFLNVCDLNFLRMLEQQKIENNIKSSLISIVKQMEEKVIQSVDYCTSVSQEEVMYINEKIKNNAIWTPIFFYNNSELSKEVPDFEERKDLLFVGGFKHLPNVDGIKWFVNNVFPEFCKRNQENIKLHIVGSNPTEEILKLAADNILVHGFISDEELNKLYRESRLAVIPLRYGAGLKGKTLEGMSNFLPFVGTEFAIQGFPEKEKYFAAYDDEKSFTDRLLKLYFDKVEWKKEQEKYREYLKLYFTSQKASDIMDDIFPL